MKRSHTCLSLISIAATDLSSTIPGATTAMAQALVQQHQYQHQPQQHRSPAQKISRSESAPELSVLANKPGWSILGKSLLADNKMTVTASSDLPSRAAAAPFSQAALAMEGAHAMSFGLPPEYEVNFHSHDLFASSTGNNEEEVEEGDEWWHWPGDETSETSAAGFARSTSRKMQGSPTNSPPLTFYSGKPSAPSPKERRLIKIVQWSSENGMVNNLHTILRLSDASEQESGDSVMSLPPPPFDPCSPTTSLILSGHCTTNGRPTIIVDINLPPSSLPMAQPRQVQGPLQGSAPGPGPGPCPNRG